MRGVRVPVVVLVVALAALGTSVGWVATQGDGVDDGWMMGRYGPGMMAYAPVEGDGGPIEDLATARRQAARFGARLGLEVGEVMRFSNHYYAELEEDGSPATEVLVQPSDGAVHIEYGPAMMWNTRYGMMGDRKWRPGDDAPGGMMGGGMMSAPGAGAPVDVPVGEAVTPPRARAIASRWLKAEAPALTAGEPERFPGYYTLHLLRDGEIAGMLSVNESTGAVWYHWWHGRFLGMQE